MGSKNDDAQKSVHVHGSLCTNRCNHPLSTPTEFFLGFDGLNPAMSVQAACFPSCAGMNFFLGEDFTCSEVWRISFP